MASMPRRAVTGSNRGAAARADVEREIAEKRAQGLRVSLGDKDHDVALAHALEVDVEFFRNPSTKFSSVPYIVDTLERSKRAGAGEKNLIYGIDSTGQDLNQASTSELDQAAVNASIEKSKAAYRGDLRKVDVEVEKLVATNYEGFNNSVQSFSAIFAEFHEASQKVRRLKDYVHRSKGALLGRKRNLNELWFQKVQAARALEIISMMEQVSTTPERVTKSLDAERFVEGVTILQNAIEVGFGSELGGVGALSCVRDKLIAQRDEMHVTLTEALLRYLTHTEGDHGGKNNMAPGAFQTLGDTGLSSKEVLSLDSIVIALNTLGRLPVALEEVKRNLREELTAVVTDHMARFGDLQVPTGVALSQAEVDAVRLARMFRHILGAFSRIFERHVQFAAILNAEAQESAKNDYSLRETWSSVQVQVQELLELHLAERGDQANLVDRGTDEDCSAGSNASIRFCFTARRDLSLRQNNNRKRTEIRSAEEMLRPICKPSPLHLLALLGPVQRFAAHGDALAETAQRPQLLGYVRDFCETSLLPRLESDGLAELRSAASIDAPHSSGGDNGEGQGNDRTISQSLSSNNEAVRITDSFFAQFKFVAAEMDALLLVGANTAWVLESFLGEFNAFCQKRVNEILKDKLCRLWSERLAPILREDPLFTMLSDSGPKAGRALSASSSKSRKVDEADDRQKRRAAHCDILLEERKQEKALIAEQPCFSGSTSDHGDVERHLLSISEIAALASLQTACDKVFSVLALGKIDAYSGSIATLKTHASARSGISSTFQPTSLKQVLVRPQVKALLAGARMRSLLAKLDKTVEQSLFALRSDFRIRCIGYLRQLPAEAVSSSSPTDSLADSSVQKSGSVAAGPHCASLLAQDLVRSSRVLMRSISCQNGFYVLWSLCGLLAETVVRALPASNSQQGGPMGTKLAQKKVASLGQALQHLQQVMWTVLLSSNDEDNVAGPSPPPGTFSLEIYSVDKKLLWEIALDQLGAFDGARRVLQSLDIQDAQESTRNLTIASHALHGTLSLDELIKIKAGYL